MDLDSNKDKYLATQESEDEEDPRLPSWSSSPSQPPSPDYSASSSENEDDVGNVQVNSDNPLSGHCPLNPEGV